MCEFCEMPKDNFGRSHMKWNVPLRSSYAEENVCEVLFDNNCDGCKSCSDEALYFALAHSSNRYTNGMQIEFRWDLGDVIIHKYSELLFFSYCPWCGRKLNESNETFEKCCVTELELMEE